MDLSNLDSFGEYGVAATALITAVTLIGKIISRFTKTPKDDAFFDRIGTAIGLKSLPPKE